jgi:hypothetical protein
MSNATIETMAELKKSQRNSSINEKGTLRKKTSHQKICKAVFKITTFPVVSPCQTT